MRDSGSETSGSEGTADIHIETGSGMQSPEFSDLNRLIEAARHDECICPGLWLHQKIRS